MRPLVSYVVVNWHTEALLPRALNSIAQQRGVEAEVFVVDNGSPGFDPAALPDLPRLTVIRNERNLGFAAANNQAIRLATGEFIVPLNADALLAPGFTEQAIEVFRANPAIGTVVPKILRDDGSGIIDSAGHIMHTDRTPTQRGRGELDQGQYDQGGFVFGGTAAAVVYRREMLLAIDHAPQESTQLGEVFDESFFAYYEDVDLDWRAQLLGWEACYQPACLAYHLSHGSGGRRRWGIQLRAEKNRYLMLIKNDTPASQLKSCRPLLIYEGWHLLKTLLKPWLWPAYLLLLAKLPKALKDRQAMEEQLGSLPDVAGWFVPRGHSVPIKPASPTGEASPGKVEPGLASVIVINYNGLALTRRCLTALTQQSYGKLEIILVDNGSAEEEGARLTSEFPQVRVLRLPRNLGFTGGVNWGVSIARGEYIALVNNDAIPHQDCLANLVDCAERTGAGAVSGRLVDLLDDSELGAARSWLNHELNPGDHPGVPLSPTLCAAFTESRQHHALSHYGYIVPGGWGKEPGSFYPSGGLCLLRREAIAELLPELLPQRFFAYYEDVFLGFSLRSRGWPVAKEPRAAALHVASSTARRMGGLRRRYWQERNRRLTLLAWLPPEVLRTLLPIRLLTWFGSGLRLLVRPAEWLGWFAAQWWLICHWREGRELRERCQQRTTSEPETWLSMLSAAVRSKGGWLSRLSARLARQHGMACRETPNPE